MILVCGEALFDLFLGDQRGQAIAAEAVAGGSPFNVAIGLARLGQTSAYFGGIARDRLGDALFDLLRSEGVDTRMTPRKNLATTLSVVAYGPDGSPRYSFYGADGADRMITLDDLPKSLPEEVRAITFGSYSIAVDPAGDTLLRLAERESGRRVISIDPNLRPSVVGDLVAWDRRFRRFLPHASLIKASEEDIALAYGPAAGLADIARDWLAAGPSCVVVTRGGEGALAFLADGAVVDAPGRKVAVADTVGAGDTFHAALLAALAESGRLTPQGVAGLGGDGLGEAVAFAILASSITCTRRGADLPRRADIEKERS